MINFYYSDKQFKKTILVGLALMCAIFIGQGIANIINGAPIFRLLTIAILAGFFFDSFTLLPAIVGAQIVGSFGGLICFLFYKRVFKNFAVTSQSDEPKLVLSNQQFIFKEVVAQIIFMMAIVFITFATFDNGLSVIDVSGLIKNIVLLVTIIALMVIFAPVKIFMISPIITFFEHLALQNYSIQNFKYKFKQIAIKKALANSNNGKVKTLFSIKIDDSFFTTYIFQLLISICVTMLVGFIVNQLKWWG